MDLTLGQAFNFACRGRDFIEVPVFKTEQESGLEWVAKRGYELSDSGDPMWIHEFLRRFPKRRKERVMSYLVPCHDWDKAKMTVVGATFAEADEPYLSQKVRSLGGTWPHQPRSTVERYAAPVENIPLEVNELKLLAHVLNGLNNTLVGDPHAWNSYTGSARLLTEVRDGMFLRRMDLEHEVDGNRLLKKLEVLSAAGRRALVLGMAFFWDANCKTEDNSFFECLRDQIHQAVSYSVGNEDQGRHGHGKRDVLG